MDDHTNSQELTDLADSYAQRPDPPGLELARHEANHHSRSIVSAAPTLQDSDTRI